MFYEEKLENGVWYYRTIRKGLWVKGRLNQYASNPPSQSRDDSDDFMTGVVMGAALASSFSSDSSDSCSSDSPSNDSSGGDFSGGGGDFGGAGAGGDW